jgi:protein SCO1/2
MPPISSGRRFFGCAAILLAVSTSVSAGPDGLVPASNVPAERPESRIEEKIGAQVPLDTVFRDENDQPITLRECIAGKPTILVPMYYRCPILCNRILAGLVETLREMPHEPDRTVGVKFNIVCVSIDPKEFGGLATAKKQAALQEYGREVANNGWRFLTSSKEAIAELTSAVGYIYEFDRAYKEYNHPSGIIILTPEGKVARYFYGIAYDRTFETADGGTTTLWLSLVEASNGKMGSLKDRLILLCYRFDHINGYSLNVLRAVQIGGILTLFLLAAGVFIALRRERRKSRTLTVATSPLLTPNELSGRTA